VAEQTRAYKATEKERQELLEEAKEAEELRDQARADLISHQKERDQTQEEVDEAEEKLEDIQEELKTSKDTVSGLQKEEGSLQQEMMRVSITRDQRWAEMNELRSSR
jgi:chromosome segregation ATPase